MNPSGAPSDVFSAVAARDLGLLGQLLKDGADPNTAAQNGTTPLCQAVIQGNLDFVVLLLDHGADVRRACHSGKAPLHVALSWGQTHIARFLVEKGADPDAASPDGLTPLCQAIGQGNLNLAEWLMEHGADVRRACHDGKTPLHFALAADHTGLAQALLEKGADPGATDDRSHTPLDVAASGAAVLRALSADIDPADLKAIVDGNSAFAAALYGRVARGTTNVFFAPASLSVALAMTYAGAQGETAREMARALCLPPLDAARLHSGFGAVAATANRAPGVELSSANALFLQQGERLLPDFVALLSERYRSAVRDVNFAQQVQASAAINHWVEAQTRGKITNLVPPQFLSALTRFVLVNAIYFKGIWASPFKKARTKEAPFFQLNGSSSPVSLMHQRGHFKFALINGGQALQLPYEAKAVAMVVILPSETDGLPQIEADLPANLHRWLDQIDDARPAVVDVYLPRFRVETTLDLGEVLETLGMHLAFDPQRADFSGMNGSVPDLYLAAVRHKAFVEVNEQGTTAAAATAVIARMLGGAPPPPPVFRADHPFLFLIREMRTKSVLFLGRLHTVSPPGTGKDPA